MANINDYIVIIKTISKGINSLIGPNMHEDIQNAKKAYKVLKNNRFIIKNKVEKTARIIKLKKHKFVKKLVNFK